MDLTKYIRYNTAHGLFELNDYQGEVNALPDDLFDQYPGIQSLYIYAKDLSVLPPSFSKLSLKRFGLRNSKLKELPAGIEAMTTLEYVEVSNNNLMDFNKEAVKLAQLPGLTHLALGGFRGNTFPAKLALLTHLEILELTNNKKNEQDVPGIFTVLAALPRLKHLRLELPHNGSETLLSEAYLPILDRLEEIQNWSVGALTDNKLPLALGLTKKVLFRHHFEKIVPPFRKHVAGKDYSPLQLQLLFGLFVKNILGIQQLVPNVLAEAAARQEKPTLRLLDRPKGETLKSLNASLEKYGIRADNSAEGAGTIVVVGTNTTMEEAEPFIVAGRSLITVDQLNEVLIGGGDHWLLEETNEPVNEQLLQLLCSNQVENYRVAFQIITTGGANRAIQSLLAAVMMAHPDKEVFKAAEKLYDKYGSQTFRQHIKESKISLRTSGDVDRKVNTVVKHPDIEGMLFRLMYHTIAGANDHIKRVDASVFSMKEIPDIQLPAEMIYFAGIRELHFEGCERLNIEEAIGLIGQMPECRVLNLNGCHLTIPASIGSLVQLEKLDIAGNTLADEMSLENLINLKELNIEGLKLRQWDWLGRLTQLTTLNINNNVLTALPTSLYGLAQLQKLEAKQNKLTSVPEQLGGLPWINYLDLSNNAIVEFPYFLGRIGLTSLVLRSNKISNIDADRLYAANQNRGLPWGELNLARNQLSSLQFKGEHRLRKLDISYNQLEVLDDSLFGSQLDSFYASNNKISVIPRAVLKRSFYTYFWVQHNNITELPDYFAQARIQNCDLSNNKIGSIHPDFDKYGKENHGRLYWKLGHNPLPRGQVGGIYI